MAGDVLISSHRWVSDTTVCTSHWQKGAHVPKIGLRQTGCWRRVSKAETLHWLKQRGLEDKDLFWRHQINPLLSTPLMLHHTNSAFLPDHSHRQSPVAELLTVKSDWTILFNPEELHHKAVANEKTSSHNEGQTWQHTEHTSDHNYQSGAFYAKTTFDPICICMGVLLQVFEVSWGDYCL